MLATDTVQGLYNLICFVFPILTFTKEEVVQSSEMFSFEESIELGVEAIEVWRVYLFLTGIYQ